MREKVFSDVDKFPAAKFHAAKKGVKMSGGENYSDEISSGGIFTRVDNPKRGLRVSSIKR